MSTTRNTKHDDTPETLEELVEKRRDELEAIAADDNHPTQWVAQAFLEATQ